MPTSSRLAPLTAAVLAIVAAGPAAGLADAAEPSRPVSIRVRWGGGTPQAWQGRIAVRPEGRPAEPVKCDWRTLCPEPDAAMLARGEDGEILIGQPRPIGHDGVEVTVPDWQRSRLSVRLGPAATGAETVVIDLPVAEILAEPVQRPLDDDGNRLIVEPAPGEGLRVSLSGDAAAATAMRRPGDAVRIHVAPLLAVKPDEAAFELRLRLSPARADEILDTQVAPLMPLPATAAAAPAGFSGGRVPTCFAGVDFEFTLPQREGVYEVALEAVERGGLRWTRPLASRTLQFVAVDRTGAEPVANEPWEVVYELDPGSPKLHERLRRLPARGLSAMPVPAITLPTMPLPSLSRPRVPLPRLPDVPLPNVTAMVPRFGGLLAAGHSVVVPHELGPMLRLPPAPRTSEPAWEGIVVANVQPGRPHVVEIDYPAAQRAGVAVCVLEPDATGSSVLVRHAGGFAADAEGTALSRHRFVFWPTSRNPLIVIANPAATPALVGRLRVTAGPERLPRAASAPAPGDSSANRRPTFAIFPTPELHRLFGGSTHVAATGGRPLADWVAHLDGIRHSAEALAAGGLAGGVVTAYRDGAASWPSRLTREAPRWDPAAIGDAGLDPLPKDVLATIASVYSREGLRLVPAFSFDAAIPVLENLLAGDRAAGILCIGGDGRPRRLPGGPHYNILDPRVQQAVEAIVVEAVGRLAGSPAASGVAILLPHDGWFHLPGVAWGLDDATFGRFLQAIGGTQDATGPDRFAERARLVTGPLREEWLAWRSGMLTAFHARLTAAVAAVDDRWPLYIVPTTLFAAGDLASRFRPALADRDTDDLLREIGLVTAVPADIRGGGRLVFMSPLMLAADGPLNERSTVAAANASPPLLRAAAAADARGGVIGSRTIRLDVAAVVPHGPFGAATPPDPVEVSLVTAETAGDRGLAETLAAADAEAIFDARAAVTLPGHPSAARAAFESLPAEPLSTLAGPPAPLAVRTAAAAGVTRAVIVNAGPAAAAVTLTIDGEAAAVLDAVSGSPLTLEAGGRLSLPLPAWGLRSLVIDGRATVGSAELSYEEVVTTALAGRIERLRQRLAVLDRPATLDVLDNPGFELGLDEPASPGGSPAVTGWELVEPRRGALRLVTGMADKPGGQRSAAGRGLEFSSRNGLSTLRSNPFAPPATGRISVAAWLRVKPGDPQPPLRIALEGIEGGREYYRFAGIGGLTGGKPLATEWALFVLQVDDLPADRVESLRVRFDLLGPGGVEIDDVRVFDLAFDAEERGRLAKEVARIDHLFKQGEVGRALLAVDGHWPSFLESFIDDATVASSLQQASPPAAAVAPPEQPRQGLLDRVRGWWR